MSNLADRIKESIADAKARGVTVAHIADACEVSVQSVYQPAPIHQPQSQSGSGDWRRGLR